MKANNTIEINGRLYDASSGKPLGSSTPQPVTPPASAAAPKKKSVDGIARIPVKVAPQSTAAPATPKRSTTSRQPASAVRLKNKRSTTLHRVAVKAPPVASKSTVPNNKATKTITASPPALHAPSLARLDRAKQIAKSSAISKFGSSAAKTTADAPQPTASQPALQQKTATATPKLGDHLSSAKISVKEELIKRALTEATTTPAQQEHLKAQKAHKKLHLLRYATTAVAVLVLVAYVAYLNVPSISMKVAAHRAGFAASLPAYKPSGYSLHGPIAYQSGQVTVNFASNTDDRRFSLQQQPTTWDSTALLENFVTKQTSNYLTYQDRGLTIYIYDGSSAAWVNGGKMYTVEGSNSRLDTDQLLKLATSV